MRIVGCFVLASCVHAAPSAPAPTRDARAVPSDAELARATACERDTGEQRRMIARGDRQLRGTWQSKLDGNAAQLLWNLEMAWDAVVPLYVHGAAPFDDSQLAQLREAGAIGSNFMLNAGTFVSIDAPLSRLACLGELEFVQRVAGHERMYPN
ncbi:MAG TPA: hypothetical protein VGL61_28085 [Kofleriaceae bacterium]|jgi:hypothetical protein